MNRGWKSRGVVAAAVLAAAAWGCDGGGPAGPEPGRGIRFVLGESATDTALGRPTQALVVEVRGDDGKPIPGLPVRFEGIAHPAPYTQEMEAYVGRVEESRTFAFIADTTDAEGRVQVMVQMGRLAGPARIAVTVPTLGMQDTARFTVTPASAHRVSMAPKDTILYAGRSYALRGGVVDRWGNRREDAVSFAASAGVTVDAKGTVTAGAVGRSFVVAQAQGKVDTVRVGIPPQGTLAAYSRKSADSLGVVVVNLDGTGFRRLAAPISSTPDHMAPAWAPSGAEIVYQDGGYSSPHLYRVDMNGSGKRLFPTPPAGLVNEQWAHFSRDGRWMFFFGGTSAWGSSLWQAAADGTGARRVGPTTAGTDDAWHPSPSPDGQRLAYVVTTYGTRVRVFDLATGEVSPLEAAGNTPRWSPTEDLIAYRKPDESIGLMKADGTGQRTVSAPGHRYDFGFNWSPDGEWLVARNNGTGMLDLIQVKTGMTFALPFSMRLSNPAWKP